MRDIGGFSIAHDRSGGRGIVPNGMAEVEFCSRIVKISFVDEEEDEDEGGKGQTDFEAKRWRKFP